MQQLLSQLGIDWHLLISQAINFFLLLIVLRIFIYKPLLQMLHDRRKRIETGIAKAEEADVRLHEADEMKRHKIKEGEAEALAILHRTEGEAKELEARMLAEAKAKEVAAMKNMDAMLRAREDESRRAAEKEAAALVRQAIIRTVEMAPEKIDDALIAKAVADVTAAAKS
jgi:F-type H+-transporting ATPase subunit b